MISLGSNASNIIRSQISKQKDQQHELPVIESTADNQITCRISLSPIPIGSKAIAPCKCIGSQKWIQFTTFNKLRRKDPSQWKTCRTCLSPYMSIYQHKNMMDLPFNAVFTSLLLDNVALLRSFVIMSLFAFGHMISFPKLLLKFIVSKSLWQQVSHDMT